MSGYAAWVWAAGSGCCGYAVLLFEVQGKVVIKVVVASEGAEPRMASAPSRLPRALPLRTSHVLETAEFDSPGDVGTLGSWSVPPSGKSPAGQIGQARSAT